MDPAVPSYSWDSDVTAEQSTKSKNKSTNEQHLLLENKNEKNRSNGQQSNPRAEEVTAVRQLKTDTPLGQRHRAQKIQT
jgi:predicted alpha/beta superfamily hydrolase